MEDQEIIARFFARDEKGLTAARARYEPYCAAVARSLLNDPRDQEECLSDTWLRAWNAIPPQRPRSLGAFLAKITRNLAINRLRDGNAQRRGGGQVPLALEELGECVSPEGSPEVELDRQAAVEALDRFLDGLPPLQREVFLRRYWYLDSIEDIARRAGWSKSRVTTTLHRLRVRLRAHLIQEEIGRASCRERV